MNVAAYGATHQGKSKDYNEDWFFADPNQGLFIIADGMGGFQQPDSASKFAGEIIAQALGPVASQLREMAADATPEGRKQVFARIEEAIRIADRALYERQQRDGRRRIATTIEVLFVAADAAFLAHVGDSRAYLVRKSDAFLLTSDHTLATQLYGQGMTKAQVESMPNANALTRALGTPQAQPDTICVDLEPGDRLLLCTDGLSTYMKRNEEITGLADEVMHATAADSFVRFANERGGRDNIAAVLVAIPDPTMDMSKSMIAQLPPELRPGTPEQQATRKTFETTAKVRLLTSAALFNGLSAQEVLRLLPLTGEKRCEEGEIVMREGEPGDELCVILDGGVQVEAGGVLLTELGPGAQVGELALVDDRPRSATIRCTAKTRLLTLERRHFQELTRSGDLAPKLLWNLVHGIADRLRTTNWQLSEQVKATYGR